MKGPTAGPKEGLSNKHCDSTFLRCAQVGTLAAVLALTSLAVQAGETATAKLHINLRENPDLGSRIVAALDKGDAIEILEERGEFVRVRKASGSQGYVKRKYLDESGAAASPAPGAAVLPAGALPEPESATPHVPPPVAVTQPQPAAEGLPHAAPPAPAMAVPKPLAPVPPVAAKSRQSWYVYGMAGVGFASESPHHIQQALNSAGGTATLNKLSLTVPTFEVAGGYHLNRTFSAELGLLDLGAYEGIISGSEADTGRLRDVLSKHYPGGGLGGDFSLGAQASAGLWSFGGRVGGFCSFDTGRQFGYAGGTLSVDTQPCAPLLAARISNAVTHSLAVGLVANAVFFDDRQFTLGVTLQYR